MKVHILTKNVTAYSLKQKQKTKQKADDYLHLASQLKERYIHDQQFAVKQRFTKVVGMEFVFLRHVSLIYKL